MSESLSSDRAILRHPDQRLRRKAEVVTAFDARLSALAEELARVMGDGPGGVGIAAPQIGENLRLILVDASLSLRPCNNHGRLFMVNPHIEEHSGETLGREGCLSVPDWVGKVARAKRIRVSFYDLEGQPHEIESSGFEARVILHEIDHLDGILFTDRVVSSRDLMRRMSES